MGQMHRLLHQPPPNGKAPLCEEEDTGDSFLEMFLQPRDQWDQPDTAGGGGEAEDKEEECCVVLHRFHDRFSQSRRRPLLGPSPG